MGEGLLPVAGLVVGLGLMAGLGFAACSAPLETAVDQDSLSDPRLSAPVDATGGSSDSRLSALVGATGGSSDPRLSALVGATGGSSDPRLSAPVDATGGSSGLFSGERANAHVRALCAPSMEGRQSGLEGGARSEEYVKNRFQEFGLQPAGDGGTYFQAFPLLSTRLVSADMELPDSLLGPIPLTVHEDFYPLTHSGSGYVTGEVIFVGHGISRPEKGWDDYGDTRINGKVALVVRGNPPVPGQDWSHEYSRNYTVNEACQRGAAAVLFLQRKNPIAGAAINEEAYHPRVPMAYIAEHVAEKLLRGAGITLEAYKEKLKSGPCLFETGRQCRLRFQVERIPEGKARNVIALLPGADPKLKHEYIVIGGHVDHLGQCPNGLDFTGANDNASGTAVVLELARAFARANPRPARSLLFAAFAGEEQGLLGSYHMTAHLPVDKERIVVMLNYDMEGHGSGPVGVGGGDAFPLVWRTFLAGPGSDLKDKIRPARAWGSGSDQAPFREIGVPVFSIWSSGPHSFYHSVEDVPEHVKPENLERVGTVSQRMIRHFADWPHALADGFSRERHLLAGGCQVDFHAAWRSGKPGGPAPGHVNGALWNLQFPPNAPAGHQSRAAAFFANLYKTKDVAPPSFVGASFGDVRNMGRGHAFTLLPCLPLEAVAHMGGQAPPYLKKLGLAFAFTDTAALVRAPAPEGLPVVARLSAKSHAAPESLENTIILFELGPGDPQVLDRACALADGKTLFVITLSADGVARSADGVDRSAYGVGLSADGVELSADGVDRSADGVDVPADASDVSADGVGLSLLLRAVKELNPGCCHLDLTALARARDESERAATLFGVVRQLLDAGLDEATVRALLGGNLLRWPSITMKEGTGS